MNEILEAAAGESGKIWIIRKYLVLLIALKLFIHYMEVGYSKEPLHPEHSLFAGLHFKFFLNFPGGLVVNALHTNAGSTGSIPDRERRSAGHTVRPEQRRFFTSVTSNRKSLAKVSCVLWVKR